MTSPTETKELTDTAPEGAFFSLEEAEALATGVIGTDVDESVTEEANDDFAVTQTPEADEPESELLEEAEIVEARQVADGSDELLTAEWSRVPVFYRRKKTRAWVKRRNGHR